MRLSAKVLVLMGIVAAVAITALVATAELVINDGFARLEQVQAADQVRRAQDLLAEQSRGLAATAADWSEWDDTYAYLSDRDPAFVRDNLDPSALDALRVDVMAFVDSAGRVVQLADRGDANSSSAVRSFGALTRSGLFVLQTPEGTRTVSGVVAPSDSPPLLVAVAPILRSDASGPARGVVVVGKLLDAEEVAVLTRLIGYPITFRTAGSSALPADFKAVAGSIRGTTDVRVVAHDEQSIASYGMAADIRGTGGLLMRVTQPRSINAVGMSTTRVFIGWLVAVTVGSWGVFFIAFDRSVRRPITRLRDDVRTIERSGEPGRHVRDGARDEIGELASSTNRMLDTLELSRESLLVSEARYRGLFESSPVAVLEADVAGLRAFGETLREQGQGDVGAYLRANPEAIASLRSAVRLEMVNPAAVKLYGAKDPEALLEALPRLLSSGEASLVTDEFVISVAEGAESFESEVLNQRIDGPPLHLMLSCRVDQAGRLLVTAVDVTSRRLAELALERHKQELEGLVASRTRDLVEANRDLQQATDAKNQFLANMSHELRTPLNSILGFSGLLLTGAVGDLSPEQARQIAMVRASGQRLLALVTDVLDLSKLEASMVEIVPAHFDANELVTSLVATVEPMATAKEIRIGAELADGNAEAYTDRERVEEILLNLLSNAVKFTKKGTVSLGVESHAGELRFRVRDSGVGIAKEHQGLIFEQFTQLPTDGVAKSAGTGLGLTISQRLARLLGGTITVTSELGSGSEFEFRLPAVYEMAGTAVAADVSRSGSDPGS